jgi:hypothetical protein
VVAVAVELVVELVQLLELPPEALVAPQPLQREVTGAFKALVALTPLKEVAEAAAGLPFPAPGAGRDL